MALPLETYNLRVSPRLEAPLLAYLKLTKLNLGYLLNWNVTLMKHGIKRMVNNLNQQNPLCVLLAFAVHN